MDIMICIRGEKGQHPFLEEIARLGAGIELGSYGFIGVRSRTAWTSKLQDHKAVRKRFTGRISLHGPFIGIMYNSRDHLVRKAVQTRIDQTFKAARALKAFRVVMHNGYSVMLSTLRIGDIWVEETSNYWKREIRRWEDAGISVAMENDVENRPDLLIKLVDEVKSPNLGVCLDAGHVNAFSDTGLPRWVELLGTRLMHVHLHDNNGDIDDHRPIGKGSIDFGSLYAALEKHVPDAVLAIETSEEISGKMKSLRKLRERFPA